MKKSFIAFCILIIGCNTNEKWIQIKANTIELRYNQLKINTIQPEDVFWIDDIKIIHKEKPFIGFKNNLVLPSGKYIRTKIGDENVYQNSNMISLALHLYNGIESIERNNYEIFSGAHLQTQGRLILRRKDKQPINLRIKPDYPIHVRVVE